MRPSDEARYVCIARNIGGTSERAIQLLVQQQPVIRIQARKNHQPTEPKVISFAQGDTVAMLCDSDGFPRPHLHWRKDAYPLKGRSMHLRIYHGQLKLFRARKSDAGAYSCHASNKAGTTAENVILRFMEPPQISTMLNYTLIQEFDTFRTTCHATGHPQPSIQWQKDNDVLDLDDERIMTKGYELIIKSVIDSDGGTYTCIATNDAGTTSEEIGLCLNHKHHYLIVLTKITF